MMTLAKGSHVPPEAVRSAARRGLELRKKHGKGGLTTQEAGKQGIGSGVARASNLAAGDAVSTETLRRMVAFFSRHRKNKSGGEDDAGYIAWLLWGGDPGEAWAKRELAKMDRVEKGGTLLQPMLDLVEVQQFGWLELPRSYVLALGDVLAKGLSHRYIRRVPTGKVTKTGKTRYRYYYHAAHGGTVGNEDHYVVGASFKDNEGHWHITARDGDTLTLKHDETGAESTMTKRELRDHLVGLHREAIAGAQERARQDIADARASGASAKQVARLRERAARVGVKVDPETPKTEPKAEAPKAATGKLEAVGDHIWGSRKDLAKKRFIESAEELDRMSYADAAAVVRKSRLVDPMTIEQAKERGMTPGGAVAALAVMAAVREKPDDTKAGRRAYFDEIREVQASLGRTKTARDVLNLLYEMQRAQASQRGNEEIEALAPGTSSAEAHRRADALSKETGRKVGVYYASIYDRDKYVLKAPKPTRYEALGLKFNAMLKAPTKAIRAGTLLDHAVQYSGATTDGQWSDLASKEVGEAAAATKAPKEAKPKQQGPAIDQPVERVGGKAIPDANPERTRDTFGFREIDYGKEGYMTQVDREHHTKALEEATHDLVDALGIDPKHASFNGRLGVAIGARGSGKALAHYEPGRHAINITKVRGGGSYAHEWGHALDDVVARHYMPDDGRAGAMGFTNSPDSRHLPSDIRNTVQSVMQAMMKHPDPVRARAEHAQRIDALTGKVDESKAKYTKIQSELSEVRALPSTPEEREVKAKRSDARAASYQNDADSLKERLAKTKGPKARRGVEDQIRMYERAVKNERELAASTRASRVRTPEDTAKLAKLETELESARTAHNDLVVKLNTMAKMDPTASDYARNAAGLGKYWAQPHEMFARAFESFVADELESKGRKNTYLTAARKTEQSPAYPGGEERQRINSSLRGLMDVLKKGGHLQKAIESLPALAKSKGTLTPLLDLLGGT